MCIRDRDVNGYLWVGTGNGLSRYNGLKFESYTTSDSLADNFITCGISDGECTWFGHMNGGLSVFNGKRFHTVKIQEKDISRITHFAKSPDGRIWASTYSDGLLRIERDSGVVKHYFFKDQTFITTFEFIDDNELLVGTNTGLLYCRLNKSGEINIIRPVTEVPGSKITCIQRIKTTTGFYIATENDGLFRLTDEYKPFKVSKVIIDPDCNLTGIQDIYEDNQSDLWLGSFGNGLIRLIKSATGEFTKIIYFNKANKFETDNVKTVFGDREGIIWSGNAGEGLTQITSKTFSVRTFDKNLYGNDIFSICLDQQYRWIGTENGLIKMDPLTDKIVKFYGKGSGLPKDTVTAIYSAGGKELWIGTGKNGMFRLETGNDKILKYPLGNETLENSVTSITGKGEQVWIGTQKGLCCVNSGTDMKRWYTISQGGLPHNY